MAHLLKTRFGYYVNRQYVLPSTDVDCILVRAQQNAQQKLSGSMGCCQPRRLGAPATVHSPISPTAKPKVRPIRPTTIPATTQAEYQACLARNAALAKSGSFLMFACKPPRSFPRLLPVGPARPLGRLGQDDGTDVSVDTSSVDIPTNPISSVPFGPFPDQGGVTNPLENTIDINSTPTSGTGPAMGPTPGQGGVASVFGNSLSVALSSLLRPSPTNTTPVQPGMVQGQYPPGTIGGIPGSTLLWGAAAVIGAVVIVKAVSRR